MKPFKNFLLLTGLVLLSVLGFSQVPTSFTVNVTQNQCYTISNTGIDSISIITPPQHGVLSTIPSNISYCPDSNFIGLDSTYVYACFGSGGFFQCNYVWILFDVQAPACTFPVSLVQDTAVCVGGNRSYLAVPSGGNGVYSYAWSDGSTGYGACEINPGQGICVTVTDGNNCSGSACSGVNTTCTLAVNISTNTPCMGPLPGLDATVSGGTPPFTFTWYDAMTQTVLLNGTSSGGASLGPICNLTPGTYCIEVYDANGCSSANCYTIQGTGGCYFTYTSGPLLGAVVNFSASNDSSVTASQWIWNFADGTSGTGQNPTHTFAGGGYYLVSMNVYYTNGDSCSYSDYVYVQDSTWNHYPGCQAWFNYYIDSSNNSTFHFADYSAYNPVSWAWDFGDGTSSTGQNPTHTYNSLGSWTVCLTTTDASGCTSNYCQQLSNVPVQDLEAYLYHQTTVTPGFPVWVYLGYYNAGTVVVNGTVTYRYPAGTTVNATSLTPASHDVANRLLTFNVGNLIPGTSDYIYVDLDASASLTLGSLATDTLWVNPIAGDATPANNVSFVIDSVVGSWDPNDKAVSPKGEGRHGIVPATTDELSYRIRFQNTGSAAAQTVQIVDVISNNIDLSSINVTGASHEHVTQVIGNQLVVTFDNINLPDSGANYAASQGYIDVRCALKPNLPIGTQIFNTADIFFDFNPPVTTNTVETTLGTYISGIAPVMSFDFALMPNPASTQVSLRGEFDRNSVYELMNQLGQVVLAGEVNSNNTTVNTQSLNAGIYLVRIKSGDKTGVQKLVITR